MAEEDEIIKLAKLHNEKAFEQIIDTYKPIIERFAYQFGVEQENIQDIVQETLLKFTEKFINIIQGNFQRGYIR